MGMGNGRSMKDILGGNGSHGSQPFAPLEYSQSAVAAAAKNGHIHVRDGGKTLAFVGGRVERFRLCRDIMAPGFFFWFVSPCFSSLRLPLRFKQFLS